MILSSMTIEIDNRDTQNVHIDTYGYFTSESYDECELENLREDYGDVDYDDFEWEYNHENIVKDLADSSIEVIEQAMKYTEYAEIITAIELVRSFSPRYYNYTTDGYKMNVTYNATKLHEYMSSHYDEIVKIASDYSTEINDNDRIYATIVHILDNCISSDDYNMAMCENVHEIYSENTTITKVKQS